MTQFVFFREDPRRIRLLGSRGISVPSCVLMTPLNLYRSLFGSSAVTTASFTLANRSSVLLACRALLEDGALELQGSLSVKVRRLHVSDRLFMARRQNGEVGGGLLRVMNADDISTCSSRASAQRPCLSRH